MSIIEEKGKGGTYSKATKSTLTEGTGMPCKGRSAEKRKKVEESRERGNSACGQATKSIARVEEEFGSKVEEKSRGTL